MYLVPVPAVIEHKAVQLSLGLGPIQSRLRYTLEVGTGTVMALIWRFSSASSSALTAATTFRFRLTDLFFSEA